MKKWMKKLKEMLNNESGFTMIELMIVIALIAIIGAMLVPSFSKTTTRARIKTDINSITTLQNSVDLYNAEMGSSATTLTSGNFLSTLTSAGFLDKGFELQTTGATLGYDTARHEVCITFNIGSDSAKGTLYDYSAYIQGLPDQGETKNSGGTSTDHKDIGYIRWN